MKNEKVKYMQFFFLNYLNNIFYVLFCVATAMIGMEIHHNAFYAVINFFLAPVSWIYWLICHDVTLSIIKSAFSFFLQ